MNFLSIFDIIGVTGRKMSIRGESIGGISHPIPFDEMAEAMLRVGRSLPFELRETAMGGCAGTPTGCEFGCSLCK